VEDQATTLEAAHGARDSSPPRLLPAGGGDYLLTPPRELGMTNVTGLPTTPNLSENIDCCKDRECIGGASLPRRFAPWYTSRTWPN